MREAWSARERGAQVRGDWQRRFGAYAEAHPIVRTSRCAATPARRCPPRPSRRSPRRSATRKPSARRWPRKGLAGTAQRGGAGAAELLGGSADPTGSNLTDWKGIALLGEGTGNHVHYGVREFGMAAIMNGVALHGGLRPTAAPS